MELTEGVVGIAFTMAQATQETASPAGASSAANSDGGLSTIATAIIAAIAAITAAIISVSGTLAGAAVTSRNNRQLERDRAEREDRTRFNSKRGEVYCRFLSSANGLIELDPIPEEQYEAFHLSYFETQVIATDPVKAAANNVFYLVVEYWGEESLRTL